ncbi:hypothetical protein RI129_011023 [Pyrocoelia pectoralis]|uniref:UBC core domain-containing protein n=1 Tax=Pyrocoelia pectoralis TaxID=417401 RepID=A0AAN7V376_9COLE
MNFDKRSQIDVTELIVNGYKVEKMTDSRYCVRFDGVKASPYEGGVWNVLVHLGRHYPFKPPVVRFMNYIYHPNVHTDYGIIYLDVLNDDKWSPVYNLCDIFQTFIPQLLNSPNPYDAINEEAADLFLNDMVQYTTIVELFIKYYATEDALIERGNTSYDTEEEGYGNITSDSDEERLSSFF